MGLNNLSTSGKEPLASQSAGSVHIAPVFWAHWHPLLWQTRCQPEAQDVLWHALTSPPVQCSPCTAAMTGTATANRRTIFMMSECGRELQSSEDVAITTGVPM